MSLPLPFDDFYHANDSASTSATLAHIHQPQPVRPIGSVVLGQRPRTLASRLQQQLGVVQSPAAFRGKDNFPGPENSLGLFSTDPKYYSVADSSMWHPALPPTPHALRRIQDLEREGGWSFDATGQTHYAPHGRIMTVDPVEENDIIPNEESLTYLDEPLPPQTTPPPRPKQRTINLIPSPILDRLPLGEQTNVQANEASFTHPNEPPPLPKQRTIDLLPFEHLPLGEDTNNIQANGNITTHTTCHSPPTTSPRQDNIEKVLASIMTALLDVVSLHAKFGALPKPDDADRDLCDRVRNALCAVQESLHRHQTLPVEQCRMRSASYRHKYDRRINSLHRTLRRLHSLSSMSPRATQITRLRKLLESHDTKLSDLARKFNGMFDRLRERYLHARLTTLYADFQRRVTAIKEDRRNTRQARSGHYDHAFHRSRHLSLIPVEVL
ncbi:hypothetical protein R3P38DRAFT_2843004 [Favolaschia claudopus]|uniref:Uncharacterized protein n=1 Tax=Favolaschia claudopus TaxID=2862362 RepID=A0AAW0E3P1_9AGAR